MADLSNLARQAASKLEFVASQLAVYQQAKNLDDDALAALLGCSLDDLTHLRLCTRHRLDHFDEDVQRTAKHVQVNAIELALVLSAV